MAYVAEHFLIHIIDFALVAVGYYLARFGRHKWVGWLLLGLYVFALAGTLTAPDGFATYWPFINAALGIVLAEMVGQFRQRGGKPEPHSRGPASR